jgi:hypothetical protein
VYALTNADAGMPGDGPMDPLPEDLARKYFQDLLIGKKKKSKKI